MFDIIINALYSYVVNMILFISACALLGYITQYADKRNKDVIPIWLYKPLEYTFYFLMLVGTIVWFS